ncbi:MAG TPA: hypothetical protein VGM32_10210 [Rhodopila sp.]|jgi:hypothetical protein
MCFACVRAANEWTIASPDEALELLAQLERPGALSREDALRLGVRLLAWSESDASRFRCEKVIPGVSMERATMEERLA